MNKYTKILLKPGKEEPVKRFHPWIFSGALAKSEGKIEEGDIVEVYSSSGEYLATGHAQHGSIAVKVFTQQKQTIDSSFWLSKLTAAHEYRKVLAYAGIEADEAFRLVNGEGDGLPGLIIDYFSGMAVIQCHSVGMHLAVPDLVNALQQVLGSRLKAVYEKSADILSEMAGFEMIDGFRLGETAPATLRVEGINYNFDFQGQKTGFFLDQRINRLKLEHYAKDKKVLDVFCYSGGFTLHALRGGAASVHAVDSSRKATDLLSSNLTLNGFQTTGFQAITQDAKQFLNHPESQYDLIILDPPAFAKHHDQKTKAIQGYRNINLQAMKIINPGGILFTFSCSQAVDKTAFQSAVMAAAIDSGRNVRILDYLGQSPDHPVSVFHPEGAYLKGLVLYIE
ncbi:MAG: class I SAM-dependent rRNA methyltransferase [Bacteroidales bacterium]